MRQTKTVILATVVTLMLLSCSHTSPTKNTTDKKGITKNGLIQFSGHWIDKTYYTKLLKDKSPKDIQDNALYLIIPEDTAKKAMVIFNFHEGNPDIKINKKGNDFFLETSFDESKENSSSKIIVISNQELRIGYKSFIKVNPYAPKDEDPYILEELLFKGKYQTLDGKTVVLTREGIISGLDQFKHYKPIIDYMNEGMEVNQIIIKDKNTKTGDNIYGFGFDQDTLIIYKLIRPTNDAADDYSPTRFGSPVYKLIRLNE